MTKQKKLITISLALIAAILIYCWVRILTTDVLATWQHYLGLLLFLIVSIFYFVSLVKAVIATGFYLLLATFNVIALTAEVTVSGIAIGPVSTPPIQLLSLGLFIIYFTLNFDTMVNLYYDYKDAKTLKNKSE